MISNRKKSFIYFINTIRKKASTDGSWLDALSGIANENKVSLDDLERSISNRSRPEEIRSILSGIFENSGASSQDTEQAIRGLDLENIFRPRGGAAPVSSASGAASSSYSEWTPGRRGGRPNFNEVGDGKNYRSAQPPDDENFYRFLKDRYGINTVISLNSQNHSTSAKNGGIGNYHHIALGTRPPSRSDWTSVILPSLRAGGVLVHCTHGADRTGAVIGRYKVEEMGMNPEDAYREALTFGFKPEDHPGWPAKCENMPEGSAERQECIADAADPNKKLRRFIYYGYQ